MTRKQLLTIIFIAFFVGALGSIAIGRFFLPYLSDIRGFSWLRNLTTDAPIVINRTEQVYLNEGANIIELTKQTSRFTASIYTGKQPQLKFAGLGTIVTSDGLIFTSKAVISTNAEVTVSLNDGRVFAGLVRAVDPKSDLAAITIEAQGLPVAGFASSMDLTAGQRVISTGMGNREFERRLESALVTSSVRNNKNLDQVFHTQKLSNSFSADFIAGYNFSGAPIVNLEGRVVAMVSNERNEMIVSENLQTALSSYLQAGKIIRPIFGVQYTNVSKVHAQLKNLPRAGALVVAVDRNSPAAEAGLLANDLVVEFDGQSLETADFEQLLNQKPAAPVSVKIIRAGEEIQLTVNLKPTQ